MAAKTIVTLHPDVECDVCGRRLLRGERPDVFLGGGQRHMVCELCTPRAAHEGWRREVEGQVAVPRGRRTPRGRSLLDRLRQRREPALAESEPAYAEPTQRSQPLEDADRLDRRIEPEWTSLDEEWAQMDTPAHAVPGTPEMAATPGLATHEAAASPEGAIDLGTVDLGAPAGGRELRRALEIFNGGETPRRIAGIARALGEACVHVTRLPEHEDVVAIVAAWELCWYRYEVDLGDELGGVRIGAEGMELEELPDEHRVANAAADEHGMLSLLAV